MSFNGSGTFLINSPGQPVVTASVISSTVFNALTADLATGLSTCITKDGQTAATARIPFANGINSTLTTDATSTGTGSIITAGGVGIAKALWVGGLANIAGALTVTGAINKITVTAPATASTLTIADGKTLTVSNTLTFTGTDSSSVNFGAGGTVSYAANPISYSDARYEIVLASKNLADATGTQAITGAGFAPVAVFAIGDVTNSTKASWGFAENTGSSESASIGTPPFAASFGDNSALISAYVDGSNYQLATVTTWGSDGITLTWTKTGSPTGTFSFYLLCVR